MTKKELRQKVYNKYKGHCAYCGKDIEFKQMQVDHILSKQRGLEKSLIQGVLIETDSLDNYNPSCRRCNHYKRAKDLEQFRDLMMTLHERIQKDYITKVGIDFGMVTVNPFSGKFYFESH